MRQGHVQSCSLPAAWSPQKHRSLRVRKAVVLGTFGAKPVKCLHDKEANIKGNTASSERLLRSKCLQTICRQVGPSYHHGFPSSVLLGSMKGSVDITSLFGKDAEGIVCLFVCFLSFQDSAMPHHRNFTYKSKSHPSLSQWLIITTIFATSLRSKMKHGL